MGVMEQTLGQPFKSSGMIHLVLEDSRECGDRRRLAQRGKRYFQMKSLPDARQQSLGGDIIGSGLEEVGQTVADGCTQRVVPELGKHLFEGRDECEGP